VKNLQATLTLEYIDRQTAEAITLAVSPDNFKPPIGLQVTTFRDNNIVINEIECEGKLSTFTATIDDLLFSIAIAEKALGIIRK
jgi:hypothetical protein